MSDVQSRGNDGDSLPLRIETAPMGSRIAPQCQSADDHMPLPSGLPGKAVCDIQSFRIGTTGTDNRHSVIPVKQPQVARHMNERRGVIAQVI